MSVYYDKEQKSWYCKFRYRDWCGNSRSTTKRGFERKKDALEYERNFRAQSQSKPTITLSAMADEYLADYKLHYKANSYRSVRKNITMYILPKIGELPISSITPFTVRKWQNYIMELPLSPASMKVILISFKAFIGFGVKYYNLSSELTSIEPLLPVADKDNNNFLEQDEWEKVASKIANDYDKVVFYTLYWSGMRIGEFLGLTINDLNFQKNTITINKQYDTIGHKISTTKSSYSVRTITMPSSCMKIIEEYVKSLSKPAEYLFQELDVRTIRTRLKRLCERAGVHVITIHGLRHSHASFLIKMGVPVNTIASRLGHSNPSITLNTYGHVYKQHDKEVAAMLNDFLPQS